MMKTVCYGILSLVVGIALCFYNIGFGIVCSVSIIGMGIISCLDKRDPHV